MEFTEMQMLGIKFVALWSVFMIAVCVIDWKIRALRKFRSDRLKRCKSTRIPRLTH